MQRKCWEAGSQSVITCMILFIKGIVIEYSVCARAFEMRKLKNCSQYLHVSEHTHWSFVYRKVPIILCKIQVHTDMQNWPSAGPKGLLAVAVCTVLNLFKLVHICIWCEIQFVFQIKDKTVLAKLVIYCPPFLWGHLETKDLCIFNARAVLSCIL